MHPFDRARVGLLDGGQDLLDAESVVAREGFASAQVTQFVEHGLPRLVRALVALDGLELDLRATGKRGDCLPRV